MSQQTAVEWLIEQLIKYKLVPEGTHHDNVLFNKAKQMEKEQLFEFFKAGQDSTEEGGKSFDQYYNETYSN
jgi:hypothetical protein